VSTLPFSRRFEKKSAGANLSNGTVTDYDTCV
jgi:hypothetical protein